MHIELMLFGAGADNMGAKASAVVESPPALCKSCCFKHRVRYFA